MPTCCDFPEVHPRARYSLSSTYLVCRVLHSIAGMWRKLNEPRSTTAASGVVVGHADVSSQSINCCHSVVVASVYMFSGHKTGKLVDLNIQAMQRCHHRHNAATFCYIGSGFKRARGAILEFNETAWVVSEVCGVLKCLTVMMMMMMMSISAFRGNQKNANGGM